MFNIFFLYHNIVLPGWVRLMGKGNTHTGYINNNCTFSKISENTNQSQVRTIILQIQAVESLKNEAYSTYLTVKNKFIYVAL